MAEFPSNLTRAQLEAADAFIKREKLRLLKIEAIDKEDFLEWLRLTFVGLLDEAENIWRWIRNQLGLSHD